MISRSDPQHNVFAIYSTNVVTPNGVIAEAVVIENGLILEITDRENVPAEIPLTDFGDLVISPGIVDAHVHINEPGRTEWEGFESATSAAAAGGVTTLIDMPLNSSPVTTTLAALVQKRAAAAGKCRVDVGFHGGLIPGNENELSALVDAGVLGIKAFLCDSGLDDFPAARESELRMALQLLRSSSVPLLAHAEITGPAPAMDDPRSYSQYAASRPDQFELDAISLLIDLCCEFRTPIHVVHLATARALEMIRAANREGLPLTVETCPHYLYFSAEEITDGATAFKCAPPIRDDANRRALCEAVDDGFINTIGSDHSPCPPELKRLDEGDFSAAWGGIAGLQLTLPITWTIGRDLGWTPDMLAERWSSRPADIFGLKQKGRIEKGLDADLVVWNPDANFVVRGEELFHRHPVTPYEGQELSGSVHRTYVRGRVVFADGKLHGEPSGRLLSRSSVGSHQDEGVALILNRLNQAQLSEILEKCCAAKGWISRMIEGGEFRDDADVRMRADHAWRGMGERDLLEAFSAHPRIGNIDSLREKYSNTKQIAGGEQSGVDSASEATIQRLASANDEYFDKFGFIFIVFASGKSAAEMLEILESRLPNDRRTELKNAAAEQLKITLIRLEKLIA